MRQGAGQLGELVPRAPPREPTTVLPCLTNLVEANDGAGESPSGNISTRGQIAGVKAACALLKRFVNQPSLLAVVIQDVRALGAKNPARMPAPTGLTNESRFYEDGERRMTDQTTPDSAKPQAETLFDRLGGVYAIAAVVDDFIDRVMNDPKLNANPAVDEAHHRVHPAGFKYLVTEQVCWAFYGL